MTRSHLADYMRVIFGDNDRRETESGAFSVILSRFSICPPASPRCTLPLVTRRKWRNRARPMSRVMCYRCYWPARHCWCGSITPLPTRTKFVILMHPYEFKRVKANTGRLTHLCLRDSELHLGIGFDEHDAVQALIHDPKNFPVLLYPGRDAIDLSTVSKDGAQFSALSAQLETRRLVVFLLDATCSGSTAFTPSAGAVLPARAVAREPRVAATDAPARPLLAARRAAPTC